MKYKITVKQLVKNHQLDYDDREENPSGVYFQTAENKDDALDDFHFTVAISCLDHFKIDIEEVK